MASPDILRHSVIIDEEEVFSLIHNVRSVPEIQPSNFTGRVAIWAEERERMGDSIEPITTYTENGPHRVSWVKHEGIDEYGEPYCTRHVVCDCALGLVEMTSPAEIVDTLVSCRGVRQALQRRAAYVDYTYKTGQILSALRNPEAGDFEQSNTFHKFAVKSIVSLLELDALHPDEWPANVISGEHRASVLATMFQLHPEVIKWYGRLLEEEEVISDFDGESLRLKPEVLAA